jgi:FkbM family methyltransferase
MNGAKRLVRSLFLRAGLDLHRLTPAADPYVQLNYALKAHGIDLVLDVGANTGQFASSLRAIGYNGRIVSFEPLSSAHARLSAAAKGASTWIVHERCAIGDRDGETEINVAGNSVSSSVLAMTDKHATAAPGSAYVGRESVQMVRLDSITRPYLRDAARPFRDAAVDQGHLVRNVLGAAVLRATALEGHARQDRERRFLSMGFAEGFYRSSGRQDAPDGRNLLQDCIGG